MVVKVGVVSTRLRLVRRSERVWEVSFVVPALGSLLIDRP